VIKIWFDSLRLELSLDCPTSATRIENYPFVSLADFSAKFLPVVLSLWNVNSSNTSLKWVLHSWYCLVFSMSDGMQNSVMPK